MAEAAATTKRSTRLAESNKGKPLHVDLKEDDDENEYAKAGPGPTSKKRVVEPGDNGRCAAAAGPSNARSALSRTCIRGKTMLRITDAVPRQRRRISQSSLCPSDTQNHLGDSNPLESKLASGPGMIPKKTLS